MPNSDTFFHLLSKGLMLLINSATPLPNYWRRKARMTRRSHVSFSLIFNTPSPYQKLEQKEGRSLDLNFVSGFLLHLSFAYVSSGRLRRPSVSLRRDLFPVRWGFVLDSPSLFQGKKSCWAQQSSDSIMHQDIDSVKLVKYLFQLTLTWCKLWV